MGGPFRAAKARTPLPTMTCQLAGGANGAQLTEQGINWADALWAASTVQELRPRFGTGPRGLATGQLLGSCTYLRGRLKGGAAFLWVVVQQCVLRGLSALIA